MKTRIFIDQIESYTVTKYVKIAKGKYEKKQITKEKIIRKTKEWQDCCKHYNDIEKKPAKSARKELAEVEMYKPFKFVPAKKEIQKEIPCETHRKGKFNKSINLTIHFLKPIEKKIKECKYITWIVKNKKNKKPDTEKYRLIEYHRSESGKPYEFYTETVELPHSKLEAEMIERNKKASSNKDHVKLEARTLDNEFVMSIMKQVA